MALRHLWFISILLPLLSTAQVSHPLDRDSLATHFRYAYIDSVASQKLKGKVSSEPDQMVAFFRQFTQNDHELARALFVNTVNTFRYDINRRKSEMNARQVMRSRSGVCRHYSYRFKLLCDAAGIPCADISGTSKGRGYWRLSSYYGTYHAWNAIQLDGEWFLLDATWADVGKDAKRKGQVAELLEAFWLSDPLFFAATHHPDNPMWQLLESPLTRKEYRQAKKPTANLNVAYQGKPGTRRSNYSYADTIAHYQALEEDEQAIELGKDAFRQGKRLGQPLFRAYFDQAEALVENRKSKDITLDDYKQAIALMEACEKAAETGRGKQARRYRKIGHRYAHNLRIRLAKLEEKIAREEARQKRGNRS